MQPAVPVLDQIRNRKVTEVAGKLVRLGGSEPKAIVAETKQFVVYRVWSATGKDLGERCSSKANFDEEFERRTR